MGKFLKENFFAVIKRIPVWVWPLFVAVPFYMSHIRHHSLFLIVFFLIPVLVVNGVISYYLFLFFSKRLQKKNINVLPEFLWIFLLCVLVYITDLKDEPKLFVWSLISFFVWVCMELMLRRTGAFYSALFAITLFSVILYSYRLLNGEERLYLTLMQTMERPDDLGVRSACPSYHPPKNEIKDGTILYYCSIYQHDRLMFELPVIKGFNFHDEKVSENNFRNQRGALPLASLSISDVDSIEPPSIGFFALPPQVGVKELENLKKGQAITLQHLQNSGLIDSIQFEGEKELHPPATPAHLYGIFWTYRELSEKERTIRYGFYLLAGLPNQTVLIVIREPYTKGLPHHPDILRVLQEMRFPEQVLDRVTKTS